MNQTHPVVLIGAGPVGLAAAAHLNERHEEVRVGSAATTGAIQGHQLSIGCFRVRFFTRGDHE